MASRYSVETIFRLIDNVTPQLDKIGVKGKVVGNALKKDFLKTQDSLSGIGTKLQSVAKYAVAAGAALVGVGIGIATKGYIEFDNALQKAGGVFSDLDPKAANFSSSLKRIGQEARAVAAATEFNAMQTADALATMAMAGIKSEQAISLLPKTADLATAAGIDLNAAAEIAADALGVFGMMTDDPIKLADNFSHLSDVMMKTASLANMDLNLMFEAVGQGGKQFTLVNQSIEDFGAAVDVLAANTFKGAEAGRSINTMMTRLAAPVTEGQKALDKLGIVTKDAKNNTLNFVEIIEQLENAFKGMGTAEVAGYLKNIFGQQQYAKALALISTGSDALRSYSDQIKNASGATAQMAGVMRQSLQNRIEVLKSTLTELGFKIVDAFAEKGGVAIEKFTESIANFDPAPIVSGLTTAANVIMWLVKTAWDLRYIIMGCAVAWGIYKIAMIAAMVVSKVMAFVKVVQGLMVAQQGMNVVQAIFNALLMANPIGLIITGVGILIGLIVVLIMNWEKVCNAVARARDTLVNTFKAMVDWVVKSQEKVLALILIFIGPFAFIISIVKELKDNWGSVVEAFKSDGILGALKQIGKVILSAVLAPIQGLLEVLAKIPGVDKLLGPAIKSMATFRNELKGIEDVGIPAMVPATVSIAGARTNTMTSGVAAVSPASASAIRQPTTPMTQAQQQSYYSRTESRETMDIYVKPEQGASARVVRPAPSPAITTRASGAYY